tara:strand:- start:222 stop:512 length:291 start_codon:yes stop_codon:yes gene_type:complete
MEKVNGYTNIQTYRLCFMLDNEYHKKGILEYFFDGVKDGEFEESDYEIINWNEVIKRYSNEQRSFYLDSMRYEYKCRKKEVTVGDRKYLVTSFTEI